MKVALFAAVAASSLGLFGLNASAQTVTEQKVVVTQKPSTGAGVGVLGGAAAGAVVGGPVGAVIGGVAGGIAGLAVDPPAEVKTYIRTQQVAPVTYDGRVAVGEVIPGTVTVYEVPNYDRYRWTYINGQRVLIDKPTGKIVSIVSDSDAVVAAAGPDAHTTVVVEKKGSAGAGVGVVSGAVTGAVVGGPVGAVIGGVVGGVAGLAIDPPARVKTYIRTQHVDAVAYDGPVAIGQALPETVAVYDIPKYDRYRWTYVNHQRILIDRHSRKIVSILNDDQ